MKQIVIKLLYALAKRYVDRTQPTIIAVTGSQGKTTTKNAIAAGLTALYPKGMIRSAEKSFNNEFGVPLSVLGEHSPGKSIFGWLRLFWRASFFNASEAPKVMVLEYGADHPGEIEHWCKMAVPDIGVITGVSAVHAQQYPGGIDDIAHEKSMIARYAKKHLVLNADDPVVAGMVQYAASDVRITTYGLNGDIAIRNIQLLPRVDDAFESGDVFAQTTAELTVEQSPVELQLPNLIGYAPVMSCAAAIAALNGTLERTALVTEIAAALESAYRPTPGRLRPIAGNKGSLIIDDSYNASPDAMMNGLNVLEQFELGTNTARRIAALGSMAELGAHSHEAHFHTGKRVAEVADVFIAVGEQMQIAAGAAKQHGMDPNAIHWFKDSEAAGRWLDAHLGPADIVYVKGAQSARMEILVKEVMADPLQAKDLLVRQEKKWLN